MVSCKRSLWINKIRVAILLSAEFRRRIVATFSMEFCTKEFHLPRSNNTQQSLHPQPPGAPKDDATAATAATLRSYAQLHRRPVRPVVHPVVRSPREVSPRLQGQLGRLKQQLHVLRSEAKMLRKNLTGNESLGCANSVFDRQRYMITFFLSFLVFLNSWWKRGLLWVAESWVERMTRNTKQPTGQDVVHVPPVMSFTWPFE